MFSTAAKGVMMSSELMRVRIADQSLNIPLLKALAVRGLTRMFDAEQHLFCFRVKRTEQGLVREGISHRYTIIALLGLHRLESTGARSPIDVKDCLEALLKNTAWISNIGDVGLLLWLCALALPERCEELYVNLGLQRALTRYRGARQVRTMELAWFLSGLSHQALARPEKSMDLKELAVRTYQLLRNNLSDKGIFGHLARGGSLAGVLRGRIGSFADQIYPIYALTRFAQAFKVKEALATALGCAEAICRVQGPLGQWWWHYDSTIGDVVRRYPVYAVHQDGMAPMALFALGEATGMDFSPSIYKGLRWIGGNNELNCDLRDTATNVIWRSIQRNKYKMYLGELSRLLISRDGFKARPDLAILFECRPYHLGWLLYAFAGQSRPQRARPSF